MSAGLGGATELDLTSRAGDTYRLAILWPETDATAQRPLRAVYTLDAGWMMGGLADALSLARHGMVRGAGPAIAQNGIGDTLIVGLGWPGAQLTDPSRRARDLADPEGARATLAFLVEEAIPHIEARLPTVPERRMIIGHSFGGAFALRAGLTHPETFTDVVAASPSLWTDPQLFGALQKVSDAAGLPRPQVSIFLGEEEQADVARRRGADPARVERLASRDMIGAARGLAARLGITPEILPGLDHGTTRALLAPRALQALWQAAPTRPDPTTRPDGDPDTDIGPRTATPPFPTRRH